MFNVKSVLSAPAFWLGLAFVLAIGLKMQAVKQNQNVKLKLTPQQEMMASFAI